MSFKKNKYKIIRKAISGDMAHYLFNLLRFKSELLKVLHKEKLIHTLEVVHGTFGDAMFKEKIYCIYGDPAFDVLLMLLQNHMEKITGVNLVPTYSYARLYKKDNELKKHKDRNSCEYSSTLNLGGTSWPIYVEGKSINLKSGDMLIYKGMELAHWRKPLKEGECGQVFLHWNNIDRKDKQPFDGRHWLGMSHACRK